MNQLAPDTLEILRQVSTATLCTQLFQRGFRNVFIQGSSRLTNSAIPSRKPASARYSEGAG